MPPSHSWPLNLDLLCSLSRAGSPILPNQRTQSCCPQQDAPMKQNRDLERNSARQTGQSVSGSAPLHLFRKKAPIVSGDLSILGQSRNGEFTKGAEKSCCDSGPDSYILLTQVGSQPHQRLQLIGYNSKVTRLTTHQRQTL